MRDLTIFFKDATTQVPSVENTGATLVANTTYYVDLTEEEGLSAGMTAITWKYDAALIATITVECTNFGDLTVYDAASLGWGALSPSPVPTLSIASSAGVSFASWADQGYGRLRAKVVVGGTGGVLRGATHHKIYRT